MSMLSSKVINFREGVISVGVRHMHFYEFMGIKKTFKTNTCDFSEAEKSLHNKNRRFK